jgi:hypothetical protein
MQNIQLAVLDLNAQFTAPLSIAPMRNCIKLLKQCVLSIDVSIGFGHGVVDLANNISDHVAVGGGSPLAVYVDVRIRAAPLIDELCTVVYLF